MSVWYEHAATTVSQLVLASAALLGAYTAYRGLNTWREQLTLQDDRELAKSIAIKIYQIRTIIDDIRNVWITDRAFFKDLYQIQSEDQKEASFTAEGKILWAKFEAVDALRAEIHPLNLEAQVLWGDDIQNRLNAFYQIIIRMELDLLQRDIKSRRAYRDEGTWQKQWDEVEAIEKRIFNVETGEDDELGQAINNSFAMLSDYLKSKLGSRP